MGSCVSNLCKNNSTVIPVDEDSIFWSFVKAKKTKDNIIDFYNFLKKHNDSENNFKGLFLDSSNNYYEKYPFPKTEKGVNIFINYFIDLIEITNFSTIPYLRKQNLYNIYLLQNIIQVFYYMYINNEILNDTKNSHLKVILRLEEVLKKIPEEYKDKFNVIKFWINLINSFKDNTELSSFYIITHDESKEISFDEIEFEYNDYFENTKNLQKIKAETQIKKQEKKEKQERRKKRLEERQKKLEERQKILVEKQKRRELRLIEKEDKERGFPIVQKLVKITPTTYKGYRTDGNGIIRTAYFQNYTNAYTFVYE